MTEQEKLDGRTKRALDMAIARKQVSQESYHAVMRGELSLADAKAIGRDGTPTTGATQGQSGPGTATGAARSVSAGGMQGGTDSPRTCLCGCREPVTRTFRPGHDAKLRSELAAQIKKGDVLLRSDRITDQQREFAVRHGLIGKEALPPETGEEN